MRVWLFLHLAGFVLWLGSGAAAMALGFVAKTLPREELRTFARLQGVLHSALLGPGAMLTVLSGLMLTLRVSGEVYGANVWLILMQATGLFGALLALFIGVPTATRLRRTDPVASPGAFDELRLRQRVVGAIIGVLALAALVAGAMVR